MWPIYPYLFIICAEALSSLLHKAKSIGSLTSVPIGKGLVQISHIFFANDILLFSKANFLEWRGLLHLLKDYERASGQVLNKDKTSIIFSRKNTP